MQIASVGKGYRFKTLSNDDVFIGDPADSKFHPKITLNRWGGECWIKLLFDDSTVSGKITTLLEQNKVKWSTPLFDFHFYPQEPDGHLAEFGGLEFEIILKQKPSTNTFSFSLDSHGLVFWYQRPLTAEELAEGNIVSAEGEGSYAAYKENHLRIHRSIADAEKYKTSKFGQIFRPKLVDSLGQTKWATLRIENNTLVITLPQDFLESATYPVKIDPTFGYTTIGTYWRTNNSQLVGLLGSPSEAGTATKIGVYHKKTGTSGTINCKCCLYRHSDDDLIDNGITNEVSVDNNAAWRDYTFPTNPSISSEEYVISVFPSSYQDIAYDIDATNMMHYKYGISYPSFPDPISWNGHENKRLSIYCTYEPSSGPLLKEVTDTIGLSDSVLTDKTFVVSDSIGVSDVIAKDATLQIQDVISLAEQILRDKTFTISDGMSLAEQILRDKTFSLSDVINLADAAYRDKTFTISDSITLVDVVEKITELLKEVVDTISLSDAVSTDKVLLIPDVVALNDEVFRHKTFIVTDAMQLTDSTFVDKLVSILDAVQLTDTVVLVTEWPGVYMLLNLKARTLRLAVSDRKQVLGLLERKLHLKVKE